MPLEEELSVESLSARIDVLERMVRDLKTRVEKSVPAVRDIWKTVPTASELGTLGDKNFSVSQRVNNNLHNPNPPEWLH
jgi:hypothetical protein